MLLTIFFPVQVWNNGALDAQHFLHEWKKGLTDKRASCIHIIKYTQKQASGLRSTHRIFSCGLFNPSLAGISKK
jgi:hypothetical protein